MAIYNNLNKLWIFLCVFNFNVLSTQTFCCEGGVGNVLFSSANSSDLMQLYSLLLQYVYMAGLRLIGRHTSVMLPLYNYNTVSLWSAKVISYATHVFLNPLYLLYS